VEIYGWVHFADPDLAESAKQSLEAEGYRVHLHRQEGGVIELVATPTAAISPEALRTRLVSVAENFGGEFFADGGSHQVVLRRRS
jgi:hypothetical protein